ncbi:MAG: hypothetical protein WC506_02485 [Candidatus Micrarchaeia archaeon]
MNWKRALGESITIYKNHLPDYVRLSLIFSLGSLMAFGAPFFISFVVFAFTIGLSLPDAASIPINIVFLLVSFVLGVAAYAAMKAAYYAGIFELYNRGTAHALNYFSFARRHMAEAAACEAIICFVPMLAITPIMIAGILMHSEAILITGGIIYFAFLTVTNYVSMFAYPAMVIDGYGSVAALKKSLKTASENGREAPLFFITLWLSQIALVLIPVIGWIIYAVAFLPVSASAVTVFYRSKRTI